ncbi:MAG: hypothetical protein JNL74_23255 [Fibrobacteres bacterium]|nr:hypothetical protein [Fibrobacterota bacterium]
MARILPPEPNLEHLRNEAKALLKAFRSKDHDACKTLQLLDHLKSFSTEQLLKLKLSLAQAQFALAMDYGFPSWDDLRKFVNKLRSEPEHTKPLPGALLIDFVYNSKTKGNHNARSLNETLRHSGTISSYDQLMGDLGLAFILQADSNWTAWGLPVGQLDIGWWPLDAWGTLMRLDFVGKAVGQEIKILPFESELYSSDPEQHFKKHHAEPIQQALKSGIAPLIYFDTCFVISGYDAGYPPILGYCPWAKEPTLERLKEFPWHVVIPGAKTEPMPRQDADRQALEYAITLFKDEIPVKSRKCAHVPERADYLTSGTKSYDLWVSLLRDPDNWGAHYYHANVVYTLYRNRQSAPPYLREMANRHAPAASAILLSAADIYEKAIVKIDGAVTNEKVLGTPEGRDNLASLMLQVRDIEAQAIQLLEKALFAMDSR